MLTMFKRLASLIPTPATNKVTLFVSDTGIPSYKDDAGLVTPMSGQPIPAGYIDGLKMEWVSGTQIRFTSGSAYIPSLGRALALAAAVTKTPSLAASTWYHAYLYSNAGTPDVEVTTTAPDTPYSGTARTKTGDTSRRYIGSFRTSAASAIFNFVHDPAGEVFYLEDSSAVPFRVLNAGLAATKTLVSCAGCCPVSAISVGGRFYNSPSSTAVASFATGGSSGWVLGVLPSSDLSVPMGLNTNQQLEYQLAGSAGGAFIDIRSYKFMR